MSIENKALLVQLNIRQWNVNRRDIGASEDVVKQTGSSAGMARVNKSLMQSDELKAVYNAASAIRKEFYDNTLPWGMDGTQILPTENYMKYTASLRSRKAEWDRLVDVFIAAYPTLARGAKKDLGSLFNPADYPTVEAVREKFSIDLTVLPLPTTDFRVALSAAEVEEIQRGVEVRLAESCHDAMTEAWSRLYKQVELLSVKLGDADAKFRASLIDNTVSLCDMLQRLNFTGDPDLDAACNGVRALVASGVNTLRNNPTVRKQTAAKAAGALRTISAMYSARYGDSEQGE